MKKLKKIRLRTLASFGADRTEQKDNPSRPSTMNPPKGENLSGTELFSRFTADIIRQDTIFTR